MATTAEVTLGHFPSLALTALAGLAGAAIDASYFSATALARGASPVGVLQGIAGFWPDGAGLRGTASALLGLATHCTLAILMAAGFALLWTKFEVFRRPALVTGPVYGLILYAMMYGLVLPIRWPTLFPRLDGWTSLLDVVVHMAIGTMFAIIIGRQPGWASLRG